MINGKTFEHRPIKELFAIVRQDFRKFEDEGYIDEGNMIKTVMYCNDRLGIPIREIRQICLTIKDYKAELPLDFEKLYFAGGITATNTIVHNMRNPFDNNVDSDVIYKAKIDSDCIGCDTAVNVVIERNTTQTIVNYENMIPLSIYDPRGMYCHIDCPNNRRPGRYTIHLEDGMVHTPFRTGEIYFMYLGTMQDTEGNILFPFHPMITPYYEWSIKEKVIMDCIFNGESNYGEMLQLAQREKGKAWLDAFDMTTSKGYGEYVAMQRKKELGWYNQYFKFFR